MRTVQPADINLSKPAQAKHKQISESILRAIEDGRWMPGDQLPSEDQLVTEMQASLPRKVS